MRASLTSKLAQTDYVSVVCCDNLSDYDTLHSATMPPRRPPPQHAAAAASLQADSNPVPAVPADQTSIAAGGGFDILTAVAALTGQSASQLRALAERYRHREGVVRTPLVLLQVLALSRQFECTRVYPSVEQSAADATAGVAAVKAMEAQVDAYGQAMRAHGQSELQERPKSTSMRLRFYDVLALVPSLACCLFACGDPATTSAAPAFWLLSVWAFYEQEQKHQWRGQLAWSLFELQQQGDSAALHKVIVERDERGKAD